MKINRWMTTLVLISLTSTCLALSRSEQLEAKLVSNPNRINVRESLAAEYFKSKKFDKVIALLAPFSNEISTETMLLLSDSYSQKGDVLNEIRVLQFYTEKEPDRFRPHYLLGVAYKKNGKLDEAADSLRSSIAHAPKHRPSYDSLLEIFIEQKQNYESRTLLNDMIRVFGRKKEFLNKLCKLFTVDNFIDDALSTCKSAISSDPSFPDNHVFLANNYYNQENRVAAEKIFKTAARQFSQSEFVQYAAGEYYINEKKYPIAIRYLKNAVKLNSESMRGHISLAIAFFEDKKYADAILHFEKSCKLDKSKETLTAIKNSAAKLQQQNELDHADKYRKVAAVCQQ